MPRRPAPRRAAVEAPPERVERPRDNGPGVVLARTDRTIAAALRPPVRLSSSYKAALGVEITADDVDDPDAVRRRVLDGLASRGKLTVADALAASLVRRVVDTTTRDAVLAVRELADRTEGPVVQRTQDVSVRYVVSLTPAGAAVEGGLLPPSPEEWERQARGEWERAQVEAGAPTLQRLPGEGGP